MERIKNSLPQSIPENEKTLQNTENKQSETLFRMLRSDDFSVLSAEKTLIQVGQNNPKTQPYIRELVKSQKADILSLLQSITPVEPKENPESTKKLRTYQKITKNLQDSLQNIQNSLDESTSLSLKTMDMVVGVFSENTVFETYNTSFRKIQSQAQDTLSKIQKIERNTLPYEQRKIYDKAIADLQILLSSKLTSTGILQMTKNQGRQAPQDIQNGLSGVKGEIIGAYEGGKSVISGTIDLALFMVNYARDEKYRGKIQEQAKIIYEFVKKEGLSGMGDKIYQALGTEMERISKLPSTEQAEAIGKIAGNVIALIITMRVSGITVGKLGKISQTERIIAKAQAAGNIERVKKVQEITQTLMKSKKGLQGFNILLNGVGESILLGGIAHSYKSVSRILADHGLSSMHKAELIQAEITKSKQLEAGNPEEESIRKAFIEVVKSEIDTLYKNLSIEDVARLGNTERIKMARFYLSGKTLSSKQQIAIFEAHSIGNTRQGAQIYQYTPEEIRQKVIILTQAGFSREERRILLEKGICGKIVSSSEDIMQLRASGNTAQEKVDYLFEQAESSKKEYNALLQKIGQSSNAISIQDSSKVPLKKKSDVLSKLDTEYKGTTEKLKDILRGSIIYDNIDDLQKGYQQFRKNDNYVALLPKERLMDPLTNDILLNIKLSNGFVTEVQLHIKETNIAKNEGYILEKSKINLDNFWTNQDREVVESIKKRGKENTENAQGRILKDDVHLPNNQEKVIGHHLYEIRRSLGNTPEETALGQKLEETEKKLYEYAKELYTERTGKPFNPKN